jgi:alcohol dehydrogenase (cytochrome c)
MKSCLLGCFLAAGAFAQGPLDPALLTKPLGDSWPTYSGDYSGKRYSSLTQINQSNVKNLTLAWVSKVAAGSAGGGRGAAPVTIGGDATSDSGG